MDNLERDSYVMQMEVDRPSVVFGAHSFGTAISFLTWFSDTLPEPALGMCEVCGRTGPPILRGPPNFG